MRLSSRTHYGTRALAELAAAWGGDPLSVAKLAKRQQLSAKYLEQIMARLRDAGLVTAVPSRGYRLSLPPARIRLNTILWVLEGSRAVGPCHKDTVPCLQRATCVTHSLWARVEAALDRCLSTITLAELIRPARQPRRPRRRRAARKGIHR